MEIFRSMNSCLLYTMLREIRMDLRDILADLVHLHIQCLKGETLSQTPKTPSLKAQHRHSDTGMMRQIQQKKEVNLRTLSINEPTKILSYVEESGVHYYTDGPRRWS